MKKLLFIITTISLFSVIKINVQAQDRPGLQETKVWIVGKLKAYTYRVPNFVGDHKFVDGEYSDLNIYFDDNNLIYSYYYNYKQNSREGDGHTSRRGIQTVIIPIRDISEYSDGLIKVQPSTIKAIITRSSSSDDKYDPPIVGNDDCIKIYDGFFIHIYIDREDDLENRMKKAFENLKYYYPKLKNTETF
jgi:hypothetical protein